MADSTNCCMTELPEVLGRMGIKRLDINDYAVLEMCAPIATLTALETLQICASLPMSLALM